MDVIKITKGFKQLLKPTKQQIELIEKTFSYCRKLWNVRLEDILKEEPIYLTIPQYKELYPYMKEVDSLALVSVERNQIQAFKNRKNNPNHFGFLNFKSKHHSSKSYTTCNQKDSVRIINSNTIQIPKLGKVKFKICNPIPNNCKITFATISKDIDNKYYVSLTCTWEKEINIALDKNNSIGLDYSSPHFYVDSQGIRADYPHFYYQYQQKLAKEQRKLSKMQCGSNKYYKQKIKIAKIHKKISNSRLNFCHQLSYSLSTRYDYIMVEDLNMQNQAQSLNFGKKVNDNGFGMFRTFLDYKLKEQGKQLIKIDKWFPSSKTCHVCGSINNDLKLGEFEWVCPNCQEHIDRDINAAINIRNIGIQMI